VKGWHTKCDGVAAEGAKYFSHTPPLRGTHNILKGNFCLQNNTYMLYNISMGIIWNLWHGCIKHSEGCANCYVYRGDAKRDVDSTIVRKTLKFNLPVAKNRKGEYKYKPGSFFYTCFTSDFLLDKADEWRQEAWDMIRERNDCRFLFITKRIERFLECAPPDWGNGWDNVIVCVTCENQKQAELRLPIFKELSIKHKVIINEPLLGPIDLSKYLDDTIEQVVVGGESGDTARVCDYNWVLDIRAQCVAANVSFNFKQTGTFLIKDGKKHTIPRYLQHAQAKEANISFAGAGENYLQK